MKSEQLFEIDRQINQIRKGLQQRQERVAEWNTPLYRVLQPLPAKDRYLSKKYSHSHLSHYQRFQGRDRASPQKMLERHLEKSRLKIKAHRNQLKQLDQLVKKRNKIRLIKLKEQSDQKRTITADTLKQSPKKEISKTFYDHFDNSSKIEKEKREHSTFAGLRGDRVLDIVQESKAMGLATEEAVGFLKKQLRIGIQSTPFWNWVQVKNRDMGIQQKQKSGKKQMMGGKQNNSNLLKNLQREVSPHRQIYFGKSHGFGSQFESRLVHLSKFSQEQAEKVMRRVG